MFIVGIFSWWYGRGWRQRATRLGDKLSGTIDYFSIDLLLRTFFSPFRQISAGKVRGPLGVQLRAFFDRLISRIIGAMIRFTMIIMGCVAIVVYAVFGVILLLGWAAVPLIPVAGLVLFLSGWIPWSL
jgi:hypothetical protein